MFNFVNVSNNDSKTDEAWKRERPFQTKFHEKVGT